MKKFIILLACISAFFSCDKDENTVNPDSFFWIPNIHVEKGDKEITLFLTDPRPYTDYYKYIPTDPDYFQIYYSNDSSSITFYKKIDISNRTIKISDLTNDESYFFRVSSHKGNYEPEFSKTIMSIPSTQRETEEVFSPFNYTLEKVSFSSDRSHFTFISNNYPQNYGYDILYVKSSLDETIKSLGIDGFNARWSPVENKLLYISSIQVDIYLYPDKLKMYNVDSDETTTLIDVDYSNYYVVMPSFSPGGSKISYLSSEGNTEKYKYDLWILDLQTKNKSKISDFESEGFLAEGNIEWSQNENIFIDGRFSDYDLNIYKFNILNKELVPVIESPWNDFGPSLSPDNQKIAFISNRSGKNELWIYDTDSKKYQQITGEKSDQFDSRYVTVQWYDENELIVNMVDYSTTKIVRIKTD